MKWFWIILAILYVLSPFDLIPGWAPFPSRIDDIIVLILLFRYLYRQKQMQSAGGQTTSGDHRQQRTNGGQERRQGAFRSGLGPKDPYEILGVSPHADQAEIRAAYRKLANQYHPDKVAHLGEEFQEMAEQRFKEIQQAYDRLVKKR